MDAALSAANGEGLGEYCCLSPEFVSDLARVNVYYNGKEFEYIISGIVMLPSKSDVLLTGAGTLVEGLQKVCLDNSRRHTGKDSADNPRLKAARPPRS